MKVLHIEAGRHLYGGAFQVRCLLEGLTKQGVENLLVCPAGSDIAAAASADAKILAIPMLGDVDPLFPFRLSRILRAERPDIVHVQSRRGADFWGGWCAKACGIPALMTRRVAYSEWGPLLRFKCKPYARIIGISDGSLVSLKAAGVPAAKMGRIYSVIQAGDYEQPADRAWFEREFGIAPGAPAVGVPAQLIESKGHRYVIEALPEVLKTLPGLRVLFLGKGAYRPELERMIAERNLGSAVTFAGFRTDMPRILPNLQLVILPTLMEGLGVSLLQASAAGVPVIGTRVGGVPEVVRDGENGLLVEPRDSSGIAAAMLKILTDPARAARYSAAGRALVRREFAPGVMVAAYLREYRALEKAATRP